MRLDSWPVIGALYVAACVVLWGGAAAYAWVHDSPLADYPIPPKDAKHYYTSHCPEGFKMLIAREPRAAVCARDLVAPEWHQHDN